LGGQAAAIMDVNVSEEMQHSAVECAALATEKHDVEREIAVLTKRQFEKKYSPTRRCTVGRLFGSSASQEAKHSIFFLVLGVNTLLFKAG
ncbi:DYL2 protein, partial [Todus mexicanus]|nr:DYL2 protein [Todus mexicanus]